jgi:pimeloyl-ACP methyl ester carboxylesterase
MTARSARSLTRLVVVAAAFTFLACGDTSPSQPSPEAIETAQSVSDPVTISAPYSTTPEAGGDDEDPVALNGRVFGDGPVGVILAHMRPADQTAWFPFATDLAATGEFTVLTFDFRGYGDSTGDKQFDRIDTDLAAAVRFMRETLDIDEMFLVGASMGGTASLVVGAREPVAGVVSISSPAEFPPFDATETVPDITAPKLFITAEDDVPQARSQEALWEVAEEPKEQYVFSGSAHGTDLFSSEHADAVSSLVLDFLVSNSAADLPAAAAP